MTSTRIALVECVFVDNEYRSPMIKGNVSALIERCLIVNPGEQIVELQPVVSEYKESGYEVKAPLLGLLDSILVRGNATPATMSFVEGLDKKLQSTVYVRGNVEFPIGGLEKAAGPLTSSNVKLEPVGGKSGLAAMEITSAKKLYTRLLDSVGPHPATRHPIDAAIIENAKKGKHRIIDSQEDVGGYPKIVEPATKPSIEVPDAKKRAAWLEDAAAKITK